MTSQPFKICIPVDKLDRLSQKLALTDFPEEISDVSWETGVPVAEIKRLVKVWQTTYDWRKAEAHLNTFPQHMSPIEVDGFGIFNIHHIHLQSSQENSIPLLFLHGWPGSFIEVTKIAEQLAKGAAGSPSFHVVAPSMVDFGFSSASGRKDFSIDQHAEAYHKLMQKLGYTEYGKSRITSRVIQAGDVGSLVARHIALSYGRSYCKAYHTNTPSPSQPNAETQPDLHAKSLSTPLTGEEQAGLARAASFSNTGMGYYKQQSTKPRTLGFSLRDSPAGLLAWMYEKMRDWSDAYAWSDDDILTWVSIYYFSTAGPDASSNVYYAMEHSEPPAFAKAQMYADVPFGVARFTNDLVLLPRIWNETLGPVVYESQHERGGHFAAWERPEVIVHDLRSMFAKPEEYGLEAIKE